MIIIRSCSSSRELKIHRASNSYLLVELAGFRVSAAVEVWDETGDVTGLQDFLADLGKQVGAWSHAREWQSLDGDFKLCVTCTALGKVVFDVELRALPGSSEEWSVTAGIDFELGQLERLSQAFDLPESR